MRRGNRTLIIPNLHQGEISVGLLTRILRQAGVSRDEWLGE
ncbi:MAG: type II toxin-antitoxin system HicA family toxin [Halothece sp.]